MRVPCPPRLLLPAFDAARRPATSWTARGALLAVFVAAGAATGCAPVDDSGGSDADTGSVHAFLRLDRISEPGRGEGGAREHASASFLRTTTGQEPHVVARLVGAVPVLPPTGQCAPIGSDDPELALHTLSPVELLQVGDVTVLSDVARTPLVARAYPDVAHLVSGVVYTTEDIADDMTRERVSFHVGGSGDVPELQVEVRVPVAASDVRINGTLLASANADRPSACAGCAQGPLAVTWAPVEPGDLFYVDVASDPGPGGVSRGTRLRCTSAGSSALLATDPSLLGGAGLIVSVHRLRTVQFQAGGLSTGEVRLDAAVSGRVGFAPAG